MTTEPFRPFAKKPCKVCPFRRTSLAGWLGDAPPEMFVNNINYEIPSPCHSSIDYADPNWKEDWENGDTGRLCTGALVLASNMCKLARKQDVIPKVPSDRVNVFGRPQEFVDHHRASKAQSWNEQDDAED